MTIEALIEVMPPPRSPFEPYNGPWEPVEAALGTSLPQDYKDFVRLYGNGEFMEFLGVNVPRSFSPYARLYSQAQVVTALFREHEQPPYPLWPEPEGLLPFGGTDFADHLFWLCRGKPDDWGVVLWDRDFGNYEAFECGLTDFLAGVVTGEIAPEGFPEGMFPCERLFVPTSPRRERVFSLSWRISYGGAGKRPFDGSD